MHTRTHIRKGIRVKVKRQGEEQIRKRKREERSKSETDGQKEGEMQRGSVGTGNHLGRLRSCAYFRSYLHSTAFSPPFNTNPCSPDAEQCGVMAETWLRKTCTRMSAE